jgi:hypothetical protein
MCLTVGKYLGYRRARLRENPADNWRRGQTGSAWKRGGWGGREGVGGEGGGGGGEMAQTMYAHMNK